MSEEPHLLLYVSVCHPLLFSSSLRPEHSQGSQGSRGGKHGAGKKNHIISHYGCWTCRSGGSYVGGRGSQAAGNLSKGTLGCGMRGEGSSVRRTLSMRMSLDRTSNSVCVLPNLVARDLQVSLRCVEEFYNKHVLRASAGGARCVHPLAHLCRNGSEKRTDSYFDRYILFHIGRADSAMRTADVVEGVVKPLTSSRQCRYTDLLEEADMWSPEVRKAPLLPRLPFIRAHE